jgi:hypothetical protein
MFRSAPVAPVVAPVPPVVAAVVATVMTSANTVCYHGGGSDNCGGPADRPAQDAAASCSCGS